MSLYQHERASLVERLRGEKGVSGTPILAKFPQNMKHELKNDLLEVEKGDDPRIKKDIVIERFVQRLVKRYYNWWFYIRGIPRIALPMLITAGQRLFDRYYITGCTDVATGESLPVHVCVQCNGDDTSTLGNTMFKSLDFVLISIAIVLLMILVRRGISEAHLCLKMLKFQILIRTSWYYWYRILMIAIISILCAGLSFVSSVFTARVNNSSMKIECSAGTHQDRSVQLQLTDYFDNFWLWLSYYVVSVLFYWPVVNFLIDIYDTPLKIFIEPEDMFIMNGEFKGEDRLMEKLSQIDTKVRFHLFVQELSQVSREMGQIPYFRLDKIPDELLQVALLRLHNKGKVKNFKKKIDIFT